MPLPQKDVRAALIEKFGFEEVKKTNHEGFSLIYGGRKIATTWFSRAAGRTMSDSLLKAMARELRIDQLAFFKEMVICTKSREEYLALLKEKGFIPEE